MITGMRDPERGCPERGEDRDGEGGGAEKM